MKKLLDQIRNRAMPDGGFTDRDFGVYRPDVTAWAVLALVAGGQEKDKDLINAARQRLVKSQLPDGRVPMSKKIHSSFWPTAYAVLAWAGSDFTEPMELASQFLLETSGRYIPNKKRFGGKAHDTSIKAWDWIDGTHSWVVPTSISLLALSKTGHGNHERVEEGIRMLCDRQITSGGWNYGNKHVFGADLVPVSEATGHALAALAGRVELSVVEKSLDYMKKEAEKIRTPLTVSWSILGLTAWNQRPSDATDRIEKSIELQKRYGPYDTDLLAQLAVALYSWPD